MANNADKIRQRSAKDDDLFSQFMSSSQAAKKYNQYKMLDKDYQKFLTALVKNSSIEREKEELKNLKGTIEEKKKKMQQLSDHIEAIEKKASEAAAAAYKNSYATATLDVKKSMSNAMVAQQQEYIKSLDAQHQKLVSENNFKIQKIQSEQEFARSQNSLTADQEAENAKKIADLQDQIAKDTAHTDSEKQKAIKLQFDEQKKANNLEREHQKHLNKLFGSAKNNRQSRIDELKEDIDNLIDEYDQLEQAGADKETLDAKKAEIKQKQFQKGLLEQLSKFTNVLSNGIKSSFSEVESIMTNYKAHVDARLQGSGKTFTDILDMTTANLSVSPYLKTQEVINAVKTASDEGIAYNLEQRAFLSAISDKIASTFDAFDSNLTRLIRLQQADSTAARLGMEASLTRFFNSMFKDTSYLTDLSKAVTGAIVDAQAVMDRSSSAEFEYVVQKWLGSLSSLGMSSTAVSSIAEGINYLATGNVQALAGNAPLQTLFAMSSNRAGLNYADLLLEGLDASNTNKLMQSMVTYLKEIAEGSDNLVVKGAWGNIFNMSMSDFRAIQNLSQGDISEIAGSRLSYKNMQQELQNQFAQLVNRTTIYEMLSNVSSNVMFTLGKNMFENPAIAAGMKMLDMADALGLRVNIPSIGIMGNFLDLNASVNDLMRIGLMLPAVFSTLGDILTGIGAKGGINLTAWGGEDINTRGDLTAGFLAGMTGQKSGSAYIGSKSVSDTEAATLSQASDEASEKDKIVSKRTGEEHDFEDFYRDVIGDSAQQFVATRDILLQRAWDEGRQSLRTVDTSMFTLLNNIFGSSGSLVSGSRLKVTDNSLQPFSTGTAIRVQDSGLNSLRQVMQNNKTNLYDLRRIFNIDADGSLTVKVKNTNAFASAFKTAGGGSISEIALKNAFTSALQETSGGDTNDSIQSNLSKIYSEVTNILSRLGYNIPVDIKAVKGTSNFNVRQ